MLFMVVETFKNQEAAAVYRRLREEGRGLPEGVRYVDSWVAASLSHCFQVVEADDASLLQDWVSQWTDLVAFEIIPVTKSQDAVQLFADKP